VVLAVGAYQFAFRWRRANLSATAWDGKIALLCGLGAVLLAAVLKVIFESRLLER
jgi:hypothetical protein